MKSAEHLRRKQRLAARLLGLVLLGSAVTHSPAVANTMPYWEKSTTKYSGQSIGCTWNLRSKSSIGDGVYLSAYSGKQIFALIVKSRKLPSFGVSVLGTTVTFDEYPQTPNKVEIVLDGIVMGIWNVERMPLAALRWADVVGIKLKTSSGDYSATAKLYAVSELESYIRACRASGIL